jgi:hypothetical protein
MQRTGSNWWSQFVPFLLFFAFAALPPGDFAFAAFRSGGFAFATGRFTVRLRPAEHDAGN